MRDWHEEYKRRYSELKKEGSPFFPFTVFKDVLVSFLIFGVLVFLAHRYGAGLDELADPTDNTYNPRPEWYFLFLFQALKYFPGNLESIAAVAMPGVFVLFLILLPFIDRSSSRHWSERPSFGILGVVALLGFGFLTWTGYKSPMTNPIVEKDPVAVDGERLYRDLRCAYCHAIGGKGGSIGPPLDKVVGNQTERWLSKHFKDPQAMTPGSQMPKMNLIDDEVKALVAYMKTLGKEPFTPEASKIFLENCAACHKIAGNGADVGPDLSLIGAVRDKGYIKRYVENPSASNPSAIMPSFKGQLTDVQLEDLARYLASLGR